MKMSNERAGDQVFTNIDQLLAEKIISRSKENSGAAEPVFGDADNPSVNPAARKNMTGMDVLNRRWDDIPHQNNSISSRGGKSIPVIRTAAAILAALVILIWIFKRGKSGS
jgi:hypothetical protein